MDLGSGRITPDSRSNCCSRSLRKTCCLAEKADDILELAYPIVWLDLLLLMHNTLFPFALDEDEAEPLLNAANRKKWSTGDWSFEQLLSMPDLDPDVAWQLVQYASSLREGLSQYLEEHDEVGLENSLCRQAWSGTTEKIPTGSYAQT